MQSTSPEATKPPMVPFYRHEEFANYTTHGLGLLGAVVATVFMLMKASASDISNAQIFGVAAYGVSMILVFLTSTLYHSAQDEARKAMFNRLDHCAIYLLIAGSYTPLLMITLQTTMADVLLVIVWLLAFAGIVFKIFYIDKFPRTSLATYLIMGWLSVLVIYQLYQAGPIELFYLLIAGGLSYTFGTIFYAIDRIPYNHAIWHIFVLLGAGFHCWAIWQYVIP